MPVFEEYCPYLISIGDFLNKKNIFKADEYAEVDKNRIHNFNRCYISNDKGIEALSVPVRKISTAMPLHEVEISYGRRWQHDHEIAIKSAYGKTPFYYFFSDDLKELFSTEYRFLYEFNRHGMNLILKWLQWEDFYELKMINDFLTKPYMNHFQVEIPDAHKISVVEIIFRFGPAGFYEILS
ncbi:MAG: WbqC family protein [Bacteroidia bacterium]|nr:WbqC family protein [Bacteroidia bacterium]